MHCSSTAAVQLLTLQLALIFLSFADESSCADARARAHLCACWSGSVCVQAWLMVALRACWCGSARASTALQACLLSSVRALAQLCARASICALQPMHIVKGPRPPRNVPPADHIVSPSPLLVPLLLSLSLSSTPSPPHPSCVTSERLRYMISYMIS